jgi:hypothetical protein
MQLTIYDGEVSPSKMAEAYTIEFSYGPDEFERGFKTGIGGIPRPTNSRTNMEIAKDGMSLLVYDLIIAMGKPCHLPGRS